MKAWGDCGACGLTVTLRVDGTVRRHNDPTGRAWVCPGAGVAPKVSRPRTPAPVGPVVVEEVPTEPIVTVDGRLWIMPGDIAHLTFLSEGTGETEEIRALAIKPRGAGPGWVLSDGTRIPLRPRTVIKIAIVFPDEHRATEHVTHPAIPCTCNDDAFDFCTATEHTTQETNTHADPDRQDA